MSTQQKTNKTFLMSSAKLFPLSILKLGAMTKIEI